MPTVADWFNEPLLHFVLAGALLFAGYAWLDRDAADPPRVVRITAAEVDWLRETWARQWLRAPDEQELHGLVSDYLKETLLAREAKDLGLDENDTVVRRRLAQKMAFLVQDTVRVAGPPDEAVLRRFYEARKAQYAIPSRISFTQLFFASETAAREALADLDTRSPAELGDRSLLGREHAEVDAQAVASVFGGEFAAEAFTLVPGEWHGPVASSYGFHLVRVDARQPMRVQGFEQVQARVREDWQSEQEAEIARQFFSSLLAKYEVVADAEIEDLIGPLAESLP